ncbi:MAG TPA: Flp family type IVb pilin [Longimicrobiales bacterium]
MEGFWRAVWRDDRGQGLTEYALIIAFVAIGLVLALSQLRDDIGQFFGYVGTQFEEAVDAGP